MDGKTIREKVRALDAMTRPVTSEEADLIAFIQDKLRNRKKISLAEAAEIDEIYQSYLGPKEDEAEDDAAEEDGVSEDDFM